jgi:GTPase SAR1 family protein
MVEPVSLFNIGTAGCGKSTLTWAMGEWMRGNDYTCALVNLDPGADALPYEPDIDVREWITTGDIMDEYGLGPNGAQIVAADMLALHLNKVVQGIDSERTQYVIFDTPGQIELFAFRESSREFIRRLFPDRSYLVYLIDPFNARTPSGFISQLMLASLAKLRFAVPCQEVISKADMVEPDLARLIDGWIGHPDNLFDSALAESGGDGEMNVELGIELYKVLDNLSLFSSLQWISAREVNGLEKIYQTIQLTYGAGEDLQNIKG